jgi:hypothetical protein
MKRQFLTESTDPQYFGNYDTPGLLDDQIGAIVLACIDHRLRNSKDWQRLLSLRSVAQWWAHIINESLIASGIHTLNLHCVSDRCPYWNKSTASIFPMLNTLVISADHRMAPQLCTLSNVRAIAIDGWLPLITQLDNLERLAVFDSLVEQEEECVYVVPPRSLITLVLLDQFLIGGEGGKPGIVTTLRQLPNLHSVVLTVGADHIKDWSDIPDLITNIEEFRLNAYYFDEYEHILKDFIRA